MFRADSWWTASLSGGSDNVGWYDEERGACEHNADDDRKSGCWRSVSPTAGRWGTDVHGLFPPKTAIDYADDLGNTNDWKWTQRNRNGCSIQNIRVPTSAAHTEDSRVWRSGIQIRSPAIVDIARPVQGFGRAVRTTTKTAKEDIPSQFQGVDEGQFGRNPASNDVQHSHAHRRAWWPNVAQQGRDCSPHPKVQNHEWPNVAQQGRSCSPHPKVQNHEVSNTHANSSASNSRPQSWKGRDFIEDSNINVTASVAALTQLVATARLDPMQLESHLEDLLVALQQQLTVSPSELVAILRLLTSVGCINKPMLDAIASQVAKAAPRFTPNELSECIWAFLEFGLCRNKAVQIMLVEALNHICGFNLSQLSKLTWPSSISGADRGLMFRAVVSQAPDVFGHNAAQQAEGSAQQELMRRLIDCTHEFPPHAVVGSLWMLAILGIRNGRLVAALADSLADSPHVFSAADLGTLAWALGTLGFRCISALETLGMEVSMRSSEFAAADLAKITFAFSTLGLRNVSALDAVAGEASVRACEFALPDLVQLAWAFATLSFSRRRLMAAIASEVISEVSQLSGDRLACLAWAFATVRMQHAGLMAAVQKEVSLRNHELSEEEMSRIHWATDTLCLATKREADFETTQPPARAQSSETAVAWQSTNTATAAKQQQSNTAAAASRHGRELESNNHTTEWTAVKEGTSWQWSAGWSEINSSKREWHSCHSDRHGNYSAGWPWQHEDYSGSESAANSDSAHLQGSIVASDGWREIHDSGRRRQWHCLGCGAQNSVLLPYCETCEASRDGDDHACEEAAAPCNNTGGPIVEEEQDVEEQEEANEEFPSVEEAMAELRMQAERKRLRPPPRTSQRRRKGNKPQEPTPEETGREEVAAELSGGDAVAGHEDSDDFGGSDVGNDLLDEALSDSDDGDKRGPAFDALVETLRQQLRSTHGETLVGRLSDVQVLSRASTALETTKGSGMTSQDRDRVMEMLETRRLAEKAAEGKARHRRKASKIEKKCEKEYIANEIKNSYSAQVDQNVRYYNSVAIRVRKGEKSVDSKVIEQVSAHHESGEQQPSKATKEERAMARRVA